MPDGSGQLQPFLEQALAGASSFAGAGTGWVDALRKAGADAYAAHGLPGRRDEYWRYTNLNALAEGSFTLAGTVADVALPELPLAGANTLAGARIVVFDGRMRPDLSDLGGLPDGVDVESLDAVLAAAPDRLEPWLGRAVRLADMPMAALNTAFLRDGVVITVENGILLNAPIHLVSLTTAGGGMVQPRHLVMLGAGASVKLIETYIGLSDDGGFNNIVSEVFLGEGARLDHFVFQNESMARIHLSGAAVEIAQGASYDSFVLQSGGLIGRNEIRAYLSGPGADCKLDGVYMGTDRQVLDNTTYVEHAAPECVSRQVYKGVLDDQSRGVFQGKVHVVRDAQKTDGHQLSRALLLSSGAEIDARPELEIYADDVKCSHGATAGELDEDWLFYLLSRGIPRPQARQMLIGAFLSEAIAEIPVAEVAEDFTTHVHNWLERHIDAAREGN